MKKTIFIILLIISIGCKDENAPPVCLIISPENQTTVKKGDTVTIEIEAFDEDGLINEVGFLLDNTVLHTLNNEPFRFILETTELDLGEHKISVYAVDNIGHNSSASIYIIVEIYNATIESDSITTLTSNSAKINGEITDNGGAEITEKGICWSISENPTISDNKIPAESDEDKFETTITDLQSNTTYHARFYAINNNGVGYSEEIVFKTLYELENFTDTRDGKVYQSVNIGDKVWMAENLAYLPNVTVPTTGSGSVGYKYVYNQTSCGCLGKARANQNYKIYGTLYNWTAAQTACPAGWHLPTDTEWEELATWISESNGNNPGTNEKWEFVGHHLKSDQYWNETNGGLNDYGFSCLPGGFRDSESKSFLGLTNEAYFWTSTEMDETTARGRTIKVDDSALYKDNFPKSSGFSVRCVRND